jgi:hypothetical protein
VSPVKYELGFYIPEDSIHHSHCCENLKSYTCCIVHSFEKWSVNHMGFEALTAMTVMHTV